jgi:hypothetical protein
MFGKDQLNGFTTNIDNATPDIVQGALIDKFENQFQMKGSNKKGFRLYENQPCTVFGDARYDIYFCVTPVGKKNNQVTQVTLVVSNGNMNCITFANDPRTSRNIVSFLEELPHDVEAYKIKLRIQTLKNELATLEKERQNLEKDKLKVKDKLTHTTAEMKTNAIEVEKKNAQINDLQDKYNANPDVTLRDQIATLAKEKQTLQKTQSNLQKTLLNLNDNLHKIDTKLEANLKSTTEKQAELKQLEQ